jgi:tetratricopeptide (TPR) repeat protein
VAVKFKFLGIPIAIGMDFFIVMAVLGLFWGNLEDLPAWLVIATLSVLLHEMGHATFYGIFGISPSIRLHGGGGLTFGRALPPAKHIVVAAAGPAMGIIVGGIVLLATMSSPKLAGNTMVQEILWINLGWSLINLLPFPGVDGGNIVNDVVTIVLRRPSPDLGRAVGLAIVALVFVAALAIGQVYLAYIIGFFAVFQMFRTGFRTSPKAGAASVAVNSPGQLIMDGRYLDAFNASRLAMVDQPKDLAPILTAADSLRLLGRYGDAEWGYSRVLEHGPSPRALRGRSAVRRRLGRTIEADEDLHMLLSLPPDQTVMQAAALYDANRFEEGYKLLGQALPVAESAETAYALLTFKGMFEWALGWPTVALAHIEESLRATPDRPDLHQLRVLTLIDLSRLDEARGEIVHALSMKPQHPEYHETLGLVERMAGNPAAGLQALTFSAEARPGDPRARAELVVCQVQLGMVGEATAALETLPGYVLHDPFVAYARAALAAGGGAADQAVAFLQEASGQRPELGLRAGLDPIFQALFADPARRAAIEVPITR